MLDNLKRHLAAIFDDDLHTRKWHNLVDYLIIGMILLSSLEIFLSTFDLDPELRKILFWVDIATLIFFTIEVSLRIWVAPVIDPRFRGWKGRLRYCFSFHGFIDMASTFPYYLQWVVPFPLVWIKLLRLSRIMRLFRISRYMKSWRLLTEAIAEKKRELLISMQFLLIITFILSLILFFFEHDRQPDVYNNGFSSVLWAFAQYIGDPGGFGDTPPMSVGGKIIASIVGLLGIAIVAVPTGILASGFTDAIEKENEKTKLEENRNKLRLCFERKLDRPTGVRAVLPYRSLVYIQANQNLTTDDIIRTVSETPGYRMINIASTIPINKNARDALAVEHFAHNKPYGLMIDRQSPVTIVVPAAFADATTGWFAYYLAMIGGFNIISKEFGVKAPYTSVYTYADEPQADSTFAEYKADLQTLLSRGGAWSVTILASSGALEPEFDTQIHFGTGNAKGNETTGNLIADKERYGQFYTLVSSELKSRFDIECDNGRYHATDAANLYLRKISRATAGGNNIVMRVAWSTMLWDPRRLAVAQTIADAINRAILSRPGNPDNPQLHAPAFGY